ncbi:unnamed protein product [Darwinula stevensoni]|uniref:Uncharacterized protein n=1 Tax=Darwinula stevensoni TaxID=69355 RepID=A0A7R9FPC3_9CRUS|nr:unnamed protein product [Darwinula stevensoni]CAG0897426.1 unnamed protein product [Darwinula stevensoni]
MIPGSWTNLTRSVLRQPSRRCCAEQDSVTPRPGVTTTTRRDRRLCSSRFVAIQLSGGSSHDRFYPARAETFLSFVAFRSLRRTGRVSSATLKKSADGTISPSENEREDPWQEAALPRVHVALEGSHVTQSLNPQFSRVGTRDKLRSHKRLKHLNLKFAFAVRYRWEPRASVVARAWCDEDLRSLLIRTPSAHTHFTYDPYYCGLRAKASNSPRGGNPNAFKEGLSGRKGGGGTRGNNHNNNNNNNNSIIPAHTPFFPLNHARSMEANLCQLGFYPQKGEMKLIGDLHARAMTKNNSNKLHHSRTLPQIINERGMSKV